MRFRFALSGVLILSSGIGPDADACSAAGTKLSPLELVENATEILVAEALSEKVVLPWTTEQDPYALLTVPVTSSLDGFDVRAKPDGIRLGEFVILEFVVRDALKGGMSTGSRLLLVGDTLTYGGRNRGKVPYKASRPTMGNCVALSYVVGRRYLFFLSDGKAYQFFGAPQNEEVASSGDPWVEWVRTTITGTVAQ